jgi:hypothetical protein
MARIKGWRAALAAMALATGLAGAAGAASPGITEHTRFLPVWLDRGDRLHAEAPMALLNLPPGWDPGDAIAILAPGGDWPIGLRDRLVAALLDAGAAVLEMGWPATAELPETVRAQIAAAILAARFQLGGGLILVIGRAEAGSHALAVAGELHEPDGAPMAAALRLGPGPARFAIADVPGMFAFPERPALLCALLAGVQPAGEPDVLAACQGAAGLAAR